MQDEKRGRKRGFLELNYLLPACLIRVCVFCMVAFVLSIVDVRRCVGVEGMAFCFSFTACNVYRLAFVFASPVSLQPSDIKRY